MISRKTIQNSNGRATESDMPDIAIFLGATAGIGRATLKLLVAKKTAIKVYIIGRNQEKHSDFLHELRKENPQATIVWLEGQISLLADGRRLAEEIKKREASIDLLFLSPGYLPFGGRNETSEGLDASIVLQYWARALLMVQLIPLLTNTIQRKATYAPRVISILAAGTENLGTLPLEDLDLRIPGHFGVFRAAEVCATLNTIFMARMAEQPRNKDVIFIHNHPGVVRTGILSKGWPNRSLVPGIIKLMKPVFLLAGAISPQESAERCLFLITSAQYGGKGVGAQGNTSLTINQTKKAGLFCVSNRMKCLQLVEFSKELKDKDVAESVWNKTQQVIQPYL